MDQFASAGIPTQRGDEPTREEVQQRISNLYDRVENATGNYNVTRAMSAATRDTARPASGGGGGQGGAADAAAPLPDVAKKWFDVGRSQLGPVFPAVLPPDRMPDRGAAGSRPADASGRPGGGGGREGRGEREGREGSDKPALELTAGPSAGPGSGGAAGPVAELTAGPVAALTAGPVAALTAGPVAALPAGPVAGLPAVPAQRQAAEKALPGPSGGPSQATLRTSKQRNQRKLGQARDLLAGHVARRGAPVAELRPFQAIEGAWGPAAQEQHPRPAAPGVNAWQQSAIGTDMRAGTDMYAGTAMYPGIPGTGAGVTADQSIGNGVYVGVGVDQYAGAPYTGVSYTGAPYAGDRQSDTSRYVDASTPIATGVALDMQQAANPGYGVPAPVPAPVPTPAPAPAYTTPAYGTPVFAAPDPGYGGQGARAVDFARAQIGKPCVWGSMGPGSYDCSSLTQAAWKVAGVALPRSVQDQATAGTMVPVSDIRPGDLVLFSGQVAHVGIATGDGMMIHAPSPGAAIREESIYWAGEAAIHSVIRPA
ncbi:C40 family peptidase [Streptomyces ortus]|uniref:NlpC/P60 family protein n=1 Tax=Streptomyces ortus TaxID=2867268 RepID=A0ABT3VD50_9ACTN|nr:C40 family peptidase [Streptomyces ortus]MCX4237864.1 NlpC/P60 family protein [Streptomyces ortus]